MNPDRTNTNLDQFYTKKEIVQRCLGIMDLSLYDKVIEPSAGNGAFYSLLPSDTRLGLDLEPAHPHIRKCDFFDFSLESEKFDNVLTIGNPPFGKNSSLAKRFFNHAAVFSNTIAFILPRTFKKKEFQNGLDLNFHLVREFLLPVNSFYTPAGDDYKVPCVFQVWNRRDEKREEVEILREHEDFEFLSTNDYDFIFKNVDISVAGSSFRTKETIKYEMTLEDFEILKKLRSKYPAFFSNHDVKKVSREINWKRKPTFAWRRAGSNAGKVCENYEDCPLEGFEFILAKNETVLCTFKKMWSDLWSPQADPSRLNMKWDTAGQASISKGELIKAYKRAIKI
tara:strand:- start:1955 stop:2971 length:1017 start_codon:yes stop_codon:yes gene_type:complete